MDEEKVERTDGWTDRSWLDRQMSIIMDEEMDTGWCINEWLHCWINGRQINWWTEEWFDESTPMTDDWLIKQLLWDNGWKCRLNTQIYAHLVICLLNSWWGQEWKKYNKREWNPLWSKVNDWPASSSLMKVLMLCALSSSDASVHVLAFTHRLCEWWNWSVNNNYRKKQPPKRRRWSVSIATR